MDNVIPEKIIDQLKPLSSSEEKSEFERLLEGMLRISNLVGSVMLLEDILNEIVQITSEMMAVPVCSIYLFDPDRRRLVMRSNIGFERELIGKASFELGQGIPGWVAKHGEQLALADAASDPRYDPMPSALELNCKAYICAPLRIQEEVIGIMTGRKTEVYDWTRQDRVFFETVTKQVAIVIEKARMHETKLQAERLAAVAVSLSGVAHYIKNVLQTMQGGEYLVESGLEHKDFNLLGEGWGVLRRANHKIRGLVENILNYCRQSQPARKAVDLNAMIREAVENISNGNEQRGEVTIHTDLDDSLGEIWADPDGIYDALLNLVLNGRDAIVESGKPGTVTVRTVRLAGRNQVQIDVIDTGMGIPEEDQDKIFNLFFTTKGKQGTGIGLAATRKIIDEHQGSIEFESKRGKGTHFRIFLPICPSETTVPVG